MPSVEGRRGAHRGRQLNSLNLACSGARTYTQTGGDFKPGLDWYNDGTRRSQVVELDAFARTHNVKAVTVLIGANNFGFADIVQQCVVNWLTSPSWWKNYCHDDSSISSRFTAAAVEARTNEVAGALANVAGAMSNAGYQPADWKLIVQTYWSPIPLGAGFRYAESGWTRQSVGGCGVWNRDADWANNTAVVKMNQALTNGVAAQWHHQLRRARHVGRAQRPSPVRARASACSRRSGPHALDATGRGRPHRVGQPDPNGHDDLRPVPAPGGDPLQLLGSAGDAQLPAPGLQRRRRPRRPMHAAPAASTAAANRTWCSPDGSAA